MDGMPLFSDKDTLETTASHVEQLKLCQPLYLTRFLDYQRT